MRKRFILVMVIVLAMLTTILGGCGSKDISGTYNGTIDYTDIMNKQLEDYNVSFSDSITGDASLELNSDKSFTFSVDVQSLIDSLKSAIVANADDLIDGIMSSQGITEDQYEAAAQMAGYDSYEDFKNEMINQMVETYEDADLSDLGLSESDTTISGTWSQSGETLELTSSSDGELGLDSGTINDDGTISLHTSGEIEGEEYTFDITFTKAES